MKINKKPRVKGTALLSLLAVWLILTVSAVEIGARLLVRLPVDYVDEKTACYRWDKTLGWFPREGTPCIHSAMFETKISNNLDGFRDIDHELPTEGRSIAFLGDSFVWGYDVAGNQRFTSVLQAYLPDWTVFNMGVSGYGTDQEYLVLQEWFPRYRPDVVVLVVHSNDRADNQTNYRDNYYKPFYELAGGRLALKGVPVPKSYRYQQQQHPLAFRSYFVRSLALIYNRAVKPRPVEVPDLQLQLIAAMDEFIKERGSQFRLVFTYEETDPNVLEYLHARNIPWQSLPTHLKFEKYGQHWTAEGHSYIAEKILESLYRDDVVADQDFKRNPNLD